MIRIPQQKLTSVICQGIHHLLTNLSFSCKKGNKNDPCGHLGSLILKTTWQTEYVRWGKHSIFAWYQRDYHRLVSIFVLCTAQKATKPLQQQRCRAARTSCPCLEHGMDTSTPSRLQPGTICAQSITQTQRPGPPPWFPTPNSNGCY